MTNPPQSPQPLGIIGMSTPPTLADAIVSRKARTLSRWASAGMAAAGFYSWSVWLSVQTPGRDLTAIIFGELMSLLGAFLGLIFALITVLSLRQGLAGAAGPAPPTSPRRWRVLPQISTQCTCGSDPISSARCAPWLNPAVLRCWGWGAMSGTPPGCSGHRHRLVFLCRDPQRIFPGGNHHGGGLRCHRRRS